jgi:hypothetical protein
MGLTGAMGLPGPPGPAGTSVTASFAFAGQVVGELGSTAFVKILEKPLLPGSYAIVTTANAVGHGTAGPIGDTEISDAAHCELRNAANGVIGGNGAAGSFTEFVSDLNEITVTGGIFVPDGTSNAASLWCRATISTGAQLVVRGAQMMVLRIGGFE